MKYKLINENFKRDYGANLLRARGVTDIDKFLNPPADCLQSYQDLVNIDEGVDILDQIKWKLNARIALIVDSDVDGFTSSAIIYTYLKKIWSDVKIDYYLHEGKQHGLEDKIDILLNSSMPYDLVIIPDAGSNDGVYIDQLLDANIKVIVIDHHVVDNQYAREGCVIINNQLSPNYLNKDLSGAGMAYQFCRALDDYYGVNYADNFLDLAAVGVCGDMMSALSYENQYLWKQGFSHINNYFLQVLCEKQSFSMGGKINPTTVAFYIVPMINGMIRIGTQDEKWRLFMAFIDGHEKVESHKRGAKGTYEEVAIESARECTNAKSHQDKAKKELSDMLDLKIQKHDLLANKVLFVRLDDEDFPSELNGLIAMQLSKKYNRPTIVARLNDDGYIRGSARGLNESGLKSFKDFLMDSGYFEYASGHDQAFGVSIFNENLADFHKYANNALSKYDFGDNTYEVNFIRSACDNDIDEICYDLVKYENVYGQQNSEPLIAITDLIINCNDVQIIGRNNDTIKIIKNGITYIKFFAKELISELQYSEMKITLVGKCNINEWRGKQSPQIIIEDLDVEDAYLAF